MLFSLTKTTLPIIPPPIKHTPNTNHRHKQQHKVKRWSKRAKVILLELHKVSPIPILPNECSCCFANPNPMNPVYFFWVNTNFLSTYTSFSLNKVFFPCHVHGNHWCLAVINIEDQQFEYYDSLQVI